MSEQKKEFVVKDRRIFAGDDKEPEASKTEKPSQNGKPEEQPLGKQPADASSAAAASADRIEDETQLPEINFITFVLSLNASALVNLGMVENPSTQTTVKNLPLAKQTIDILGMLQEKTRGNLSADEENLIQHMLYELRLIYVKEKK